ncbi:hypothetical protein I7I50_02004 [Histoplasma capsulatum G186AR]|uniref:Uncharacterized protein n=1 Tax=Ajellomyces capsulatus TaxID=5037 RepID=A0A8H8CT39_AJECA|nr:hypothetical protein I7I52_12218 [Histoplasma capsulatum]QSS71239.1 hypothetical protein I7I50_02004 [Histoplasma capsulatum G186AR]
MTICGIDLGFFPASGFRPQTSALRQHPNDKSHLSICVHFASTSLPDHAIDKRGLMRPWEESLLPTRF